MERKKVDPGPKGRGQRIIRLLRTSNGSSLIGQTEKDWQAAVRVWVAGREDCLWLGKVELYRTCRVAGVVSRLLIDPRAGVIEVTVTDGSTSLGARWAITRPVPQLRAVPGSGLILEGMARLDERGELLMVEPAFEIVAGPEYQ
jgi:hypothetical protein